jgi:hypothetical protein
MRLGRPSDRSLHLASGSRRAAKPEMEVVDDAAGAGDGDRHEHAQRTFSVHQVTIARSVPEL